MAVYTEISEKEAASFCRQAGAGELRSLEGIAQGVINSNFKVVTDTGARILTVYESAQDAQALPFVLSLQKHLHGRGVPCPQPLGEGVIKGKPATLMSFLPGSTLSTPTLAQCAAIGAALARMHIAGADFPLQRQNPWSLEKWQEQFGACKKHAAGVPKDLGKIITEELSFLSHAWPHDLPAGPIHADLFPDNAMFEGPRLAGIIDFAYACTDAFAYDLMMTFNGWCGDAARAESFLNAYQSVRPLSPAEVSSLPVMGRGAALRIVLLRLDLQQRHPDIARSNGKNPYELAARILSFRENGVNVERRPAGLGLR